VRAGFDDRLSEAGARVVTTEIQEGVIDDKNGAAVSAFLVDHGPVKPAFGYRVDYAAHSVVLSGDTRLSENVIKHSQGVDLLIHEVAPIVSPDPKLSERARSQQENRPGTPHDGTADGRRFQSNEATSGPLFARWWASGTCRSSKNLRRAFGGW
jgi:ribonuclease BN (tRNA processing enzyme)